MNPGHVLRLLFLSVLIQVIRAKEGLDPAEPIDVNKVHSPRAQCKFSVHDKNSTGPEVEGTNLNQELYYKITCHKDEGYCLLVANCTVSTGSDQKDPYIIIDSQGCTTEPSLFEHVEYLDDFTGGIYNPYPIRFRNPENSLHFQCATVLKPRELGGHCERPSCTKNHYSKEANFHSH